MQCVDGLSFVLSGEQREDLARASSTLSEPLPDRHLEQRVAASHINIAFRLAGRKLTPAERAIFSVRIKDAVALGATNAWELAWKALELEGWRPKSVIAGGMLAIGLDGPVLDSES